MSWKRTECRWLRPVFYVCVGILPALALALLSLIAALVSKLGVLISAIAWLGTLGLVLAVFNRPANVGRRLRLAIVALLILGLIEALAFLYGALSRSLREVWPLLLIVGGPMSLALHYVWQVGQISNARERRILAAILICIAGVPVLVYLIKPNPPKQVIYATAPTDEITLIVDADTGLEGASMGLTYIAKFPYARINFNGRAYTPIAPRVRVSIPWDGVPSRYVVTESVRKNPRSYWWPIQVTWTLSDQQSGKVMARRELWRDRTHEWSTDTPGGLQGDHAARFVQEVFQTTRTWSGHVHTYPLIQVGVERVAAELILPEESQNSAPGCGGRVEVIDKGSDAYVQSVTPDWTFQPESPVDQVFCVGSDTYVVSGVIPEIIYIDKLGSDGYPVDQFQMRVPDGSIQNGYRFRHISSFTAGPQGISMLVDFLKPTNITSLRRADLTLKVSTE